MREVIKDTVLKYAQAQLILMVIALAEAVIGLLIIGAPNVAGIATIIAFLGLMPVFGPAVFMIPRAVIEFLQGNS
ncbi:MAG: AI-2E family transporter [Clostridiales bacterium]|nr:AI-2E family transporter [Clostridiales bacterium]